MKSDKEIFEKVNEYHEDETFGLPLKDYRDIKPEYKEAPKRKEDTNARAAMTPEEYDDYLKEQLERIDVLNAGFE